MFSYDELAGEFLQAIEGIDTELERPAGAFTSDELAIQLGRSRSWVIRRIKQLIREGKAETVKFSIRNLTGKVVHTTGYRLINESQNGGIKVKHEKDSS